MATRQKKSRKTASRSASVKKKTKRSVRKARKAPAKSAARRAKTRAKAPPARLATARLATAPRATGGAAAVPDSGTLSATLEAVSLGTTPSRLEALEAKLDALEKLADELRKRQPATPAERRQIAKTIAAIENAISVVEAQIAAEKTPVLGAPGKEDVDALLKAIRESEDAIAQNAAVNQMVRAANALIGALG